MPTLCSTYGDAASARRSVDAVMDVELAQAATVSCLLRVKPS